MRLRPRLALSAALAVGAFALLAPTDRAGIAAIVRQVIAPGLVLFEADGVGPQKLTFVSPIAMSADRTCQLVDGTAPIPDSCVGDGVDGGGGGSGDITDVFDCASGDCGDILVGATDSLDFSAIDANAAGEGLILPQTGTCGGAGQATGSTCYGTTNDELCVWDGAAWDCQVLGASGTTLSIDGVSMGAAANFDDGGDINFTDDADGTVSTAVKADSVALGTDTTGNYAGSGSEGGAATTATALAANGANCAAGTYPLGVDASGAAETCSGNFAASVSAAGPATTATALVANGANCSAGSYPLGVDASGAAESCTVGWITQVTQADADSSDQTVYVALSDLDWTASAATNYHWQCRFLVSANATGTGIQLQTQGPTSPTLINIIRWYANTNSATTWIWSSAFHSSSTDDGAIVSSGTTFSPLVIDGILLNGANSGTVAMAVETETTGAAVHVYKGSYCMHQSF